MGNDYYKVMQTGGRQAAAAARESKKAISELSGQLVSAKEIVSGFTGAIAGALTVTSLINMADNWGQVTSRLKMATSSANELATVQHRLMEISDRTYKPIEEQSELFIRSANAMKELGYNTESTLDFIDSISSALTINAASADKGASTINALSKAMVQGKVAGDNWNTVMEVTPTIVGDIARYMGITETAVKQLASSGKLSMQQFSDAVIAAQKRNAQLAEDMPTTVGDSITKLTNHLKAYIGDANNATGTTQVLSGAISDLADNIDTVAATAGIIAAISGVKYASGMLGNLGAQTGNILEARKNEIALAAARSQSAIQSQRKAVADALAAERSYQLAKAELDLAKNTNAEAAATQNAIAKRRAMIAANATLVQSNMAVSASQEALNKTTSILSVVKNGASGLLSLVGGIPGVLMLGAGAWYTMYQKQEQARQSAIQYADTIEQVRNSIKSMSQTQIAANLGQANISLDAQDYNIEQQKQTIAELSNQLYNAKQAAKTAAEGTWLYNDATEKAATFSSELAVEEGRLEQMLKKRQQTQSLITDITNEAINKTVEMTGAVSSLADMYNRLNRVTRQTVMPTPAYAGPILQSLDPKQQSAMERAKRQAELAGLKGIERARKQAEFEASDLNLPAGQYEKYINYTIEGERKLQELRGSSKKSGGKSESEKTEDVYSRIIKQQEEQIALAGQSNELAKIKYQVTQGELSSLSAAKKEILLQNAALIDQKDIAEQLKTFREGLADSNAAARDRGNIDFLGAGMGDKARDRMKEMADIRIDFLNQQRDLQRDFSKGQISEDLYKQQTEALQAALAERLQIQEDYYKKSDEQQSDWQAGISDSLMNYADKAADLSSMAATATSEILNNTTSAISNNLTSVLTGATSFKEGMSNIFTSLGETVIQTLIQMATQALITKAIMASFGGGAGGLFGGLLGGASSGTALQSFGSSFSFNALGGVYDSPSLSAYSNGIYSTPQYFAFAKGAGVFGEAGPEAIMPLTRGADGSLGVRAVGYQSPAVQDAARQIEAQPRIAVSVDARSTFSGQPDDATMLAVDRRNAALERKIINTLTAEVHNPQKKFGRAIYSNLQSKKPQ